MINPDLEVYLEYNCSGSSVYSPIQTGGCSGNFIYYKDLENESDNLPGKMSSGSKAKPVTRGRNGKEPIGEKRKTGRSASASEAGARSSCT